MMHWQALLGGLGFGFIVAAPVGPMALLLINRTLQRGFAAGCATGAGIALADAAYALITVAGFRALTNFTTGYNTPLQVLGSLFLVYLGVKALRAPSSGSAAEAGRSGNTYFLLSSLLLTLANPATILSFMALSASLGASAGRSLLLPAGIASGSLCWWLLLSAVVVWIRGRVPDTLIRRLHILTALLLMGFALFTFWNALTGGR
ncbi:LysE family translocator [Paenibacillus tepidiphilus]|uniref:LysE family translocator n=1 Tax=Paenibacillus tepidiphilus TaxID=2608683 RepID=UPI001238FED1|nr:LysE family transporter [Paenibacillus tepidiphilus]